MPPRDGGGPTEAGPTAEDRSPATETKSSGLGIEEWATTIRADMLRAVEGIVAAGHHLIEAKADLGHGNFTVMVKGRLGFSLRTAERLMAIASNPVLSNPTHRVALPPSWGTLAELAKISEHRLEHAIAGRKVRPDMTRAKAEELAKKLAPPPPKAKKVEPIHPIEPDDHVTRRAKLAGAAARRLAEQDAVEAAQRQVAEQDPPPPMHVVQAGPADAPRRASPGCRGRARQR